MSQRQQKNITTLKPIKNKILDLETKRLINYISITTKIVKDKSYNCWWCTLPIEDNPIGCPLSMQISTDPQSVEQITYYTDGLFCCLNCIKAYIIKHGEHDANYKDSVRLLAIMACDIEQIMNPLTINPSPPWRFLQQYGGHLTVDQYREMIDRMIYKEKGIIQIQPITTLYEEDEKF